MANPSLHESFMNSRRNSSDPSHPVPPSIIHTPKTSSFASVLRSHIHNLRFDTPQTPKPLLFLTPTHVSHVGAAVIAAQKHNLHMKIRGGGHDYDGVSYVSESPFFLLDMQNLRAIEIGVAAWVQAGATLGELHNKIAKTSKVHGFPAEICPSVGVGGHLSGGGCGNMIRKYGLSIDNVIDAQIVDARLRVLDRKSLWEDMFWAIRGGGGASFCVVVAYKSRSDSGNCNRFRSGENVGEERNRRRRLSVARRRS